MPSNDRSVEFATYPNEMVAQMVAQLLRENVWEHILSQWVR